MYSQYALFSVTIFYKVATNAELVNIKTLLLGEIQG